MILPLHYRLSLDILPMQASAVSSERVFSSAADTKTKDRNCLSDFNMEALQILKYAWKCEPLKTVGKWQLATDAELLAADCLASPQKVFELLGAGKIDELLDLFK